MVKHAQKIRQQIADELFECVWPFEGLALKGVIQLLTNSQENSYSKVPF